LFSERVSSATTKHKSRTAIKDAKQLVAEEKAKQRDMDNVGATIEKTRQKLKELREKWVDNSEVNLTDNDKTDLSNMYGNIEKQLNTSSQKGRLTRTEIQNLTNMVRDYENKAK